MLTFSQISCRSLIVSSFFFFFNDSATTDIYTLSLHDALPIWSGVDGERRAPLDVTDLDTVARDRDPGNRLNFGGDRKSTRLNSSHTVISYAVFCLKKKKINMTDSRKVNTH